MTTLLAGAATADIPPRDWQGLIDGYAARRTPPRGGHDPLFARALVLDHGEKACAIAGCDLLGMHSSIATEVRRRAHESLGIDPDGLLVAATHSHPGPAVVDTVSMTRRPPDWPTDPVLRLLLIDGEDGRPVASLLNFACHATVL